MSKVIHKYQLAVMDRQELMMPQGAHILAVQFQGGTLCAWAMHDTATADIQARRAILIHGTGHGFNISYSPGAPKTRYLATVQQGPFVWHVFEEVPACA